MAVKRYEISINPILYETTSPTTISAHDSIGAATKRLEPPSQMQTTEYQATNSNAKLSGKWTRYHSTIRKAKQEQHAPEHAKELQESPINIDPHNQHDQPSRHERESMT